MKPKKTAAPKARTEQRVRLRVICVAPPRPERFGAVFGLQDNSTTQEWVIHPGQAQSNGDIHFECECRVRPNERTGKPNFLGPFMHGGSTERFFYLSWRPTGWCPGQPDPPCPAWVRRIKVHLSAITWTQIDQALRTRGVLQATVPGTGRDGGPSCASVPLVGGAWTRSRVHDRALTARSPSDRPGHRTRKPKRRRTSDDTSPS